MTNKVDKPSKTDNMTADKETKPMNFQALRETVLTERQAKIDADAALAQGLAGDHVAISLTGPNAADALLDWIDEGIDG